MLSAAAAVAAAAASFIIAGPPEEWSVTSAGSIGTIERTTPATVFGMSWNLRSRKMEWLAQLASQPAHRSAPLPQSTRAQASSPAPLQATQAEKQARSQRPAQGCIHRHEQSWERRHVGEIAAGSVGCERKNADPLF